MDAKKFLIVNADDFGLSQGVNHGIIRAHEHGIVTSASLMVRQPAAAAAAAYARSHPNFSVGLHVDLCEWRCVNDEWRLVYEVVPLNDMAAVAAEIARQRVRFRELTGREPTHLDSHQHVHHSEPVKSALAAGARELGVVLRQTDARVHYCGSFYGQSDKGHACHESISVEALTTVFHQLPPGVSELCCHPGLDAELNSVYRVEREIECRTLCDARVRAAIAAEGIKLCSFSSVALTAR